MTIDNLAFSPATLNLKTGQQVTWTNQQDIAHTVTADGGAFDHQMPPGATFSFTFDKAGSFPYHCTIHPSMTATIQVARRLGASPIRVLGPVLIGRPPGGAVPPHAAR